MLGFSAENNKNVEVENEVLKEDTVDCDEYVDLAAAQNSGLAPHEELLMGRRPVEKMSPSQCKSIVTWAMPQLTDRSKLPNIVDPVIRDTMDLKQLYQGLDASFNADGDGNGDEDNEDQENDDKDNDDLVLLLPLSISGLLLFGFAISHRAEFHRLGLCVTVSLHHSNGNVVSVWVCA
ncbi:hypothetical protein LWI29_027251 [Acer saccharum]|uniref:Uncharacterized protein n=1 Tax=Acer saccharum TaxID=4024 RepID=A0AA39SSW9_ACESA|nr:hypothetical protein LWI29_027251 [Acer saccharum]